jgi:hypothetical protein
MSSTTKKIDVEFMIVQQSAFKTIPHRSSAAKETAELACRLESNKLGPQLMVCWVDADGTAKSKRVAITTTRDTTARLSSLKKMIQNGEPIDG